MAKLGACLCLTLGWARALPLPGHSRARPLYRGSWRWGGQRRITSRRIRQIQAALVRAGYLNLISGHWDAATIDALRKYQTAHHWQTRFVPDARALIALNLGPRQDYRPGARALPPASTPPATAPGARATSGAGHSSATSAPAGATDHHRS